MSQNLFAVVLTSGKEQGAKFIKEKYPKASFGLTQDTFVIVAESTLSRDIAESVGLTADTRDLGVRGAVFKLNGSYTGYANQAIWEWLEEAESGSFA